MNKIGVFFLAIFLSLVIVSAVESTIEQNYRPGETLIAEISGNFINPLTSENILFYSGRLFVPMVYDLIRINDKYYVYAILPNKERNYTMIISDAKYLEENQEKTGDLEFNFTVKGNLSAFQINPGVIVTGKDFSIKATALKNIELEADFTNSSQNASLIDSQTKTFFFTISDVKKTGLEYVVFSSQDTYYNVPVMIYKNQTVEDREIKLIFSRKNYNFSIVREQEFGFEVAIFNTGKENISEVNFSSSSQIKIFPEKTSLDSGELKTINLTMTSSEIGTQTILLTASSGNYSKTTSVTLTTFDTPEELLAADNTTEIITEESCSSMGGGQCAEGEECIGTNRYALEGWCCIGTCKASGTSSSGKVIAIIVIVIILAGIGFFIFVKIKSRKQSSSKLLEEKSADFESRYKPMKIAGNLSKF